MHQIEVQHLPQWLHYIILIVTTKLMKASLHGTIGLEYRISDAFGYDPFLSTVDMKSHLQTWDLPLKIKYHIVQLP